MMYAEVGRLADETIQLSVRLAENTVLLTVAAHYAWMETWLSEYRQTEAIVSAHLKQQARTNRLIQRGIPAALAAQGLRVL